MGKVKPGTLGVFSGAVGDVIYATWKGIPYVRARPASVADPRTEAQLNQRAKFALAMRFLKPCTDFIRTGYQKYAIKKTAFNAAQSYILSNAITGSYPDYRIDYSRVLMSRGSLAPPFNAQVGVADGAVQISWDDHSVSGLADPTDNAMAIVINPEKGETVYKKAGASRIHGMETLDIPMYWAGNQVEVYLGFISDDGKDVSDSVYVGSVMIP